MNVLDGDCDHADSMSPVVVLLRLSVRLLMVVSGVCLVSYLVSYGPADVYASMTLVLAGAVVSIVGAFTVVGFLGLLVVLLVRRHPLACAVSLATRETSVFRVTLVLLSALAHFF